jgi:replication factor C subunit 2/4
MISGEALQAIERASDGDLRKAINILQATKACNMNEKVIIDIDHVAHCTGDVPESSIKGLIAACSKGKIEPVIKKVNELLREGYASHTIILKVYDLIVHHPSLHDLSKARICTAIAVAEKCLIDGADDKLQLIHIASVIQRNWNTNTQ